MSHIPTASELDALANAPLESERPIAEMQNELAELCKSILLSPYMVAKIGEDL